MGRRMSSFGSWGIDFGDDEEEDEEDEEYEEDWDEQFLRIIDTYCKVCEEVTIHKIKNGKKRCIQCLTVTVLT